MFPYTRLKPMVSMAAGLAVIAAMLTAFYFLIAAPGASAASHVGTHHVFDQDTTITSRFVLRPGDSVELRNGACLCFADGGSADWQGTPMSTWSNDGTVQNLVRDIKITGAGHIRFMKGSTTSTIRFVEIDVRPPLELAKYPLHFHHAGDGVSGTLVEGVVIKNSLNRAFVAHASHGITFRDTIAKNIAGSPYWWDPPAFQSQDQSDNSNNITYDHALVDGVTPRKGERGGRLAGFTLGMGTGNRVINSAAMNVQGGKESAGFVWPEGHHRQPHTWVFTNNVAHDNTANGIFVWQNNSQEHIIDGFRGYANGLNDLNHGAYSNRYDYRNITVERVEIHALGWSVTGGSIGTITTKRHALEGGAVTFRDVAVARLVIQNASNNGDVAGTYVFTNTGLTWDDVTVEELVSGTTVVIDGTKRYYNQSGTRFNDVPRSYVFAGDIEWLANKGITRGCNPPANTRYCPESIVTRGVMAALLVRAMHLPAATRDHFGDDNGSTFENDINRLAEAGISKGCNPPTNDRFCPDSKVTRQQMAAFLVRAIGYTDDGDGNLFIDDDDSIFENDIDKLGTAGVTKGCNPPVNDRYCPGTVVTRGQMAAFLHRALG